MRQTALVVGPQGQLHATGNNELHTDVMGRIRVRFHWQGSGQGESPTGAEAFDRCWLRVQQRLAGAAMGHQFIPRIGQAVLVGFLGNDIDRPVVIASLTVLMLSGAAPGLAGAEGSFVHGRQQPEGKEAVRNKDQKGYDHQSSYNDPRARFAALYGIAKAAQKATWHE